MSTRTVVAAVAAAVVTFGCAQLPTTPRDAAWKQCDTSQPGAHCDVEVQVLFSFPVRVASGQVQSTWSMLAGITQARPDGHPVVPVAAACAVGSQLNEQVW